MKYKVIVFDFFGVMSTVVAPRWFKEYFADDAITEIKKKYVQPSDAGTITEGDFFNEVSYLVPKTPAAIRGEWMDMVSINTDLVAYIKTLRNSYKTALCSNSPSLFLRDIMKKNELDGLYDSIIISGEVHIIKPDPAIFKLVLNTFDAEPHEAIFIDDSPRNVAGAKALGMNSFIFSGVEKLKADLASIGVVA